MTSSATRFLGGKSMMQKDLQRKGLISMDNLMSNLGGRNGERTMMEEDMCSNGQLPSYLLHLYLELQGCCSLLSASAARFAPQSAYVHLQCTLEACPCRHDSYYCMVHKPLLNQHAASFLRLRVETARPSFEEIHLFLHLQPVTDPVCWHAPPSKLAAS